MTHRSTRHPYTAAVVTVIAIALIGACAGPRGRTLPDPRVVEAFTSGEISRWSSIQVVFTEPVGQDAGTVVEESILTFSPRITISIGAPSSRR